MANYPHRRSIHALRYTLLISALILIRFGFGLSYVTAVPPWEAYDEPAHFGYAAHLLTTHTLPRETDAVLNPERIQPPFYYLVLATFLSVSGSSVSGFNFPKIYPYFYYGTSGYNYTLHPSTLTSDQRAIEISLRVGRILSLILSLLGVPFVYLAARMIWPSRLRLPLSASAIFAMRPQYLFNGSMVTNDSMTPLVGAIITWTLLKFQAPQRRSKGSIAWGLLTTLVLVLGVFVKLNIVMLAATLVVVTLMTASRRAIGT